MSSLSSTTLPGALKALADNPLEFLKKYAIMFAPENVPPEYHSDDGSLFRSGKALVELLPSPSVKTNYNVQFVALNDLTSHNNAADGFVLAYNKRNGDDDVPYVDIPRKAYNKNTFLFTIGLSGCSVIVTRRDDTTYRVFHDRRVDSAVLYKDVEICVNFDDYRIGGRYLSHTGTAATFMIFQGGEWKMFLQRQLPGTNRSKPTWETYPVMQIPMTAEELEKKFKNRRAIIQKRVTGNGRILNVGDSLLTGAVDGIVGGPDYNEEAIAGWKVLRSAIKFRSIIIAWIPKGTSHTMICTIVARTTIVTRSKWTRRGSGCRSGKEELTCTRIVQIVLNRYFIQTRVL